MHSPNLRTPPTAARVLEGLIVATVAVVVVCATVATTLGG